jgi:hypothetical protein
MTDEQVVLESNGAAHAGVIRPNADDDEPLGFFKHTESRDTTPAFFISQASFPDKTQVNPRLRKELLQILFFRTPVCS